MEEKDNYPEFIEREYKFYVTNGKEPERIDLFLTNNIRNVSRNKVQKAIDEGLVTINGVPVKANRTIKPGEIIRCRLMKPPPIELLPEDIPLNVVYEDEHLLVLNKQAGMVAHPGYGNRYGTMVNAVLYHLGFRDSVLVEGDEDDAGKDDAIFSIDAIRPGIVHRLDKDTTGLVVVAKNDDIHAKLALQFSERTVEKIYYTIVWGKFIEDEGTYKGFIGRNSLDRKLFAVVRSEGKSAFTDFKVLKRFGYLTLVQVKLRTGRTHQIRVHFSNDHHPVLGDKQYSGDSIIFGGQNPEFKKLAETILGTINRQMLHAKVLGFVHPVTNEFLRFESELPDDMVEVLNLLENQPEF